MSTARINLFTGPTSMSVVIAVGDMQATVTLPAPSGGPLSEGPARLAALRAARRALDIAREELDHELGASR